MKKILIALAIILSLSGCASYKQYGPIVGDPTAQARIFLLGHTNRLPITAMLKLQLIDSKEVWDGTIVAYDMQPKTYDLHYRLFLTSTCPSGDCTKFGVTRLRHPYKIRAQLKPGYAYIPFLRSETEIDNEICLYGEPIGAQGQRVVTGVLNLSNRAEKIACGSFDTAITYQ